MIPVERAQLFESYRQTGHVDLIEVEWKRKDGTPMKVRLSGRQVGIEEGAPDGCEVIAEDVTAQRASEDTSPSLGGNRCADWAGKLPQAFRNSRIGDQTLRTHRTGLCRPPF